MVADSRCRPLQASVPAFMRGTRLLELSVLLTLTACGVGDGGTTPPTEVRNPVPATAAITTGIALVGGAGNVVRVSGSGFFSGSVIRVDGQDRATTVVSPTEVTFVLTASDTDSAATRAVTVYNGPPGGGVSQPLTLSVQFPAPALTSIAPASLVRSAPSRDTITITGTGFTTRSTISLNGVAPVKPIFVSSTTLRYAPPFDSLVGGTYAVTVANVAPGGGTSAGVNLEVVNPVPTLTALLPDSAMEGQASTAVTLTGRNFFPGMIVSVAGHPRPTQLTSSTSGVLTVSPEDIAIRGSTNIMARNVGPTVTGSSSLAFRIIGRTPVITALLPDSVLAGSSAIRFQVAGRNFNTFANVNVNGTETSTAFISPTLLEVNLPASAIASPMNVPVVVKNAGGLESAPTTLRIVPPLARIASVRRFDIVASDMEWVPSLGRLYAAVRTGADAGRVVGLTPVTGAITDRITIGAALGDMALSADQRFLFAARTAEPSIARIALGSGAGVHDLDIAIRADPVLGTVFAEDLATLPGLPRTVVASLQRNPILPLRHAGIAVFDDGVERRRRTLPTERASRIESASGTVVYGFDNETVENGMRRFTLTDSGFVLSATRLNIGQFYGAEMTFAGSRLYIDRGEAFDATTFNRVGFFTAYGPMAANAPLGRLFIYYFNSLRSFALGTLEPIDQELVDIGITNGAPALQIIQIAPDQVAIRTFTQIVIVRGSFFF